MNLAPSEEQSQLAKSVSDFLVKELPIARLRALPQGAPSIDEMTWFRCADLGWLGVGLDEHHGGIGYGAAEEVLLFRELGRYLTPGPFVATALGARVAAQMGDRALANDLLTGRRRAGMLVGSLALDARPGDLVLQVTGDGAALLEPEVSESRRCVDPFVSLSSVSSMSVVAETANSALLPRARLLTGAMLLGISEAVRDMSAEYGRERVQFSRPIGSNQAVKHRCANMAVRCYAARSEVFLAAALSDDGRVDSGFHAASAQVLALDAARANCADNIQNHGALGFTQEHDAGLYLKRTHILERSLGPTRQLLADVLSHPRHEFA